MQYRAQLTALHRQFEKHGEKYTNQLAIQANFPLAKVKAKGYPCGVNAGLMDPGPAMLARLAGDGAVVVKRLIYPEFCDDGRVRVLYLIGDAKGWDEFLGLCERIPTALLNLPPNGKAILDEMAPQGLGTPITWANWLFELATRRRRTILIRATQYSTEGPDNPVDYNPARNDHVYSVLDLARASEFALAFIEAETAAWEVKPPTPIAADVVGKGKKKRGRSKAKDKPIDKLIMDEWNKATHGTFDKLATFLRREGHTVDAAYVKRIVRRHQRRERLAKQRATNSKKKPVK